MYTGPLPLLSVQAMFVDQELEPLERRLVNAPLGKVITLVTIRVFSLCELLCLHYHQF